MKSIKTLCDAKLVYIVLCLCLILISCTEEDDGFALAASLTVVHGAAGAPSVHVDYFGDELEELNFFINPPLTFGSDNRFTIPANETRTLGFTYATDTTRETFAEEIRLRPGQISTYFLLGDSANHTSVMLDDTGLKTFQDSLNAVRFVNMATGVESLTIGFEDSTAVLASGLTFGEGTEFMEVDATLANPNYHFTFKDETDSVLASYNFEQYQILIFPGLTFVSTRALRRNLTFALVGKLEGGEGNSSLEVVQINHF